MNIHVAQSIQARNELARITNVKYQIVGAKDSNPIIGCVQDALSGAFMLTKDDVKLSRSEVANLLCNTTAETRFKLSKQKEFTGHEAFSYIIPEGINSSRGKFLVKDGKLIRGRLDKSQLSTSKNSLVHFIWDKYGPEETQNFIDDAQRFVLNYLLLRGQTIGFGDTILSDKMIKTIGEYINTKVLSVKHQITEYENSKDKISPELIEGLITSELGSIGTNVGKMVADSLTEENSFMSFMKDYGSGAKGSSMNVQKAFGCVGQLSINGARISKRVEGRTLPYFHRDDDTAEARGFVNNTYLDGTQGFEFFFDAMAGREGLIDTAIKSVTWETPIVVIDNEQPKYIEIGKWIDKHLEENREKVKHYTDRDMELLDTDNMYIPTTDDKGNVTWGEITAITRHDPGKQLYKIKTYGGREVIVTESKSLLVWNNELDGFYEKLTPNIKVGDYLPVNCELRESPIKLDNVDVSNYLSKKEYIYGTDYNKAIKLMNTAMENRSKIPFGWWNENNGVNFTLPYTKKSSLQRCSVRSNQENIKDGYIYPYHARRKDTLISDNFELNYNNGVFIGLFLAEGCCDKYNIRITNVNDDIRTFVKNWFDKHNIKWDEEDKINSMGGRSVTVRGNSSILSSFLTKFVGSKSTNKFVPNESYISNLDFVKGLLNGYFSGDGCIGRNNIYVGSSSKQLINGISMLLNRLNIFGKMSISQTTKNNLNTENIQPSYRLFISSRWGKQFSDNIDLIDEIKDKKLKSCSWTNDHRNFEQINNVVKDKILEISLVDIEEHPKVYDLTIPSTLNFSLANGLQVRDTAKTGYISRKLIKALEDLTVRYDGTIRMSGGTVIQYIYGENGINQLTQTQIKLPFIEYSDKEIIDNYGFDSSQIKKVKKKDKNVDNINKKIISTMKKFRSELREIYFNSKMNYGVIEDKFMLPVNFNRIIQEYNNDKPLVELKPTDIVDAIEDILDDYEHRLLVLNDKKNKLIKDDEKSFKTLYRMALYHYLSPKKCIFEYGLSKEEFNKLCNEIKLNYTKSLVEPGEMVGVIAAQSVGEPTSQMTLDTKHSAGVIKTGAIAGVPRILELLSYSKNIKTPITTIYYKDGINTNKGEVNRISSYYKHLTIDELIKSVEIIYDTNGTDELSKLIKDDNVTNPFFINNQKAQLNSLPLVFRFKMDLESMMDKETTLLDIKTRFISYWYKNFTNFKTLKKTEKSIISKINRLAILDNSSDIIHIRFSMSKFNYTLLTDFLKIVLNTVTLKGIDGIEGVSNEEKRRILINDDGSTEIIKEFVTSTNGINLTKLKMMKGIDHTRTRINDIKTTLRTYGIEAARSILYYELVNVFGDGKINHNHLALLIDLMTHTGSITSIDRHGLSKLDTAPMTKASFEKTMDHFLNASLYNEVDDINSVSSRIMVGRVIPGGTGAFDLLINTEKLENMEYTKDETGGRVTFKPLEEENILDDIMKYGINETDFFIPI